jgi:hypothetical protein
MQRNMSRIGKDAFRGLQALVKLHVDGKRGNRTHTYFVGGGHERRDQIGIYLSASSCRERLVYEAQQQNRHNSHYKFHRQLAQHISI